VLMGGLQNVYGRVHGDLLRLFLCVASGNWVVSLRPPSLASQLLQGIAVTCRSWLASEGALDHTADFAIDGLGRIAHNP